ncbi:lipopolysaccharide/colanic/teichoic acid biosynthesis glycosyltransferase [Deinobacterium chartae]|uniref:Lipopolysaccharide/colanic/teichoic acid biosynthesis glycosyltransferase n=1 Tax=Deinobacterium chartae TaxID=521158 RepID=A0A841I0Q2_9DEIO|nr:sugar transferase [Deinobacterium chartae]MBB6097848.1 lipopolysaccharide/colanic/teichoic acid biosynthesis glycosyltransferase [Deinobacterium chartae]
MKRMLYLVTVPLSARSFLRGQLAHFRAAGWELHLAAAPEPAADLEEVARQEGVTAHQLPMQREIAPLHDAAALLRTWWLMRRLRPQIVNAGTPKAGLLGSVAAALAGVPVRVYTLHGLRLETTRGLKRRILQLTERVACACAHRVVCVSPSLRERAVALGVVPAAKAVVLGHGTCNGLEAQRFAPEATDITQTAALRTRLNLPEGTPVIGFVGRFVRDKGIVELLDAFGRIYARKPEVRLLLLGDHEPGDPLPLEARRTLEQHPGIVRAGFVPDTAPYYPLMHLLAFPTHREGFGTVALEAAAAGLAVVTTNATGARDAVVDGVTGLRVPVGDAHRLEVALLELLEQPQRARALGAAGRERVLRDFRPQQAWEQLGALYASLLTERHRAHGDRLKRALDVVASALGLLLLAPLMVGVALLVRLQMGSPVIFRQVRPGLHGRPFAMYKFRTMRDATDPQGRPLPDSERLTSLGRFLRATSLDELPELFNVLRGEMSLVGPRPLLMEYLELYTPEQARRHEVRPGITGWAQVNGRNALSWEEKFALDVWYVDHHNFWLDLKILWLTVIKVFRREGISAAGDATMPRFTGSSSRNGT